MAVRNDLIPLPVIKQWSKRLQKAWPDVKGSDKPTLSVCQEALARVLGHSDWKMLLRDYAPTPETSPSKNPDSTMDVISNIFEQAVDKQYSSIVWKVGHEKAVMFGKHHGQETETMTMSRDRSIEILKVIYNVLSENADVSFHHHLPQSAFFKMDIKKQPMMLFYRSIPLINGLLQVEIQLVSCDWKATPSMDLGAIHFHHKGISILAAPTEELRRELMSRVVAGLTRRHHDKNILVITDRPQPLIEGNPNVTVAPVIRYSHTISFEEGLKKTLHQSQSLGQHILVVDCRDILNAWKDMMEARHKGIACVVVMDASDVMDVLVQLDQQQHLSPLLRYGVLQSVVTVQQHQQLDDITPQVLSLDEQRCGDLLGAAPYAWPRMLKGWRTT